MMACVVDRPTDFSLPDYSGAGIPLFRLRGRSRRGYLWTACSLARLLRKERVQILHAHHFDQALIGWLATRLHPKTRLVVGRHYSDSIYRSSKGLKKRLWLMLESLVNRAADRIVVPSTYIREILTDWQHVPGRKVAVIPYGFVPEKYHPPSSETVARLRSTLGGSNRFLIGTFGRLHEEKGHRFLLEALGQLQNEGVRDVRLVIAGDGPERGAIEKQIAALGLEESVTLLGFRKDVIELMSAMDAVVQPTLQEAFSQAMIEALWMKKALVITKVSGATDVIQHGKNGLLVDKQDSQALAQAIRMLAGDPQMCRELGDEGHAFVEANLSIERIIGRYEECYLELVGAKMASSHGGEAQRRLPRVLMWRMLRRASRTMYKTLRQLAVVLKAAVCGPSLRVGSACWFCARWLIYTLASRSSKTVAIKVPSWGTIHLRTRTSDLDVFLQHVVYRELFELSSHGINDVAAIVDAGANIGLSSLALSQIFPNGRICAIEPDVSNCDMFARNCRSLIESGRVRLLRGAFYPYQANLRLVTSGRDYWNRSTEEAAEPGLADTAAIDLETLEREAGATPDFVKMDIEGAELAFFRDGEAFARLLSYGHLLVELHGPDAHLEFFSRLHDAHFDCLEQLGEYWFVSCPRPAAMRRRQPAFA